MPRVAVVAGPDQRSATPDFAALRSLHRSWVLDDHREHGGVAAGAAAGTLARYARFLHWARPGEVIDAAREGSPPRCPDDLALAITFFTTHSIPDGMVWHRLQAVTASTTGPNPYDAALAWAAGWRGPDDIGTATGLVDEVAVLALIEQLQAAVTGSVRLLGERTGIAIVGQEEIPSLAAAMAMSLLGGCDCGHHVRQCRGCGRGCCFPDHDLRTWNPSVCHLRPFLDQAVRGTAQRRIMGGAFAAGLLYAALEREGRLLCRTVEWGRCELCGRSFEGSHCPEPHAAVPHSVRREPRKNQLILPPIGASGHAPTQRWWCEPCQHLFGVAGGRRRVAADCPRCGRPVTTSRTVWTKLRPHVGRHRR